MSLEQVDAKLGAGEGNRDARRAPTRADVDDRAFFDELCGGERVVDQHAASLARVAHGGQAGRAQHRLEPALEPRIAHGHSGGAGAMTTCRFGSVPSLEVTTSWRSAR